MLNSTKIGTITNLRTLALVIVAIAAGGCGDGSFPAEIQGNWELTQEVNGGDCGDTGQTRTVSFAVEGTRASLNIPGATNQRALGNADSIGNGIKVSVAYTYGEGEEITEHFELTGNGDSMTGSSRYEKNSGCGGTTTIRGSRMGSSPGPGTQPPPERSNLCSDVCEHAGDGECDDGGAGAVTSACEYGTDCGDCGARESGAATTAPTDATEPSEPSSLCSDACEHAGDGECDDGGTGAVTSACEYGSDCSDCGSR